MRRCGATEEFRNANKTNENRSVRTGQGELANSRQFSATAWTTWPKNAFRRSAEVLLRYFANFIRKCLMQTKQQMKIGLCEQVSVN
jgi:hypothetical protein